MHADMDTCEREVVDKLKNPPRTHRERIYDEHRVKKLVKTIVSTGHNLNEIYQDSTKYSITSLYFTYDLSVRRDELASMQGVNALSIFYDKLKDIREIHRRSGMEEPATMVDGIDLDLVNEEGEYISVFLF